MFLDLERVRKGELMRFNEQVKNDPLTAEHRRHFGPFLIRKEDEVKVKVPLKWLKTSLGTF